MTPNPNPSPEEALRHLELLALNTAQTAPAARKVNECVSIITAALSPQTLPATGEVERLRQALRNIAEGNLGDAPWQANYARIKEVATEALGIQPAAAEPFGYWIEQRLAEPVLLRKPSYIPEPSELRTVTPLYASPTLATVAAANDEGVGKAIEDAAKVADAERDAARVAHHETPVSDTAERAYRRGRGEAATAIGYLIRSKSRLRSLPTSRLHHEGADNG